MIVLMIQFDSDIICLFSVRNTIKAGNVMYFSATYENYVAAVLILLFCFQTEIMRLMASNDRLKTTTKATV